MPAPKNTKTAEMRLSVHPVLLNLLDYEARKRGMHRATLIEEIISSAFLDRAELRKEIDALVANRKEFLELKAQIQAIADLIVDQSFRAR